MIIVIIIIYILVYSKLYLKTNCYIIIKKKYRINSLQITFDFEIYI